MRSVLKCDYSLFPARSDPNTTRGNQFSPFSLPPQSHDQPNDHRLSCDHMKHTCLSWLFIVIRHLDLSGVIKLDIKTEHVINYMFTIYQTFQNRSSTQVNHRKYDFRSEFCGCFIVYICWCMQHKFRRVNLIGRRWRLDDYIPLGVALIQALDWKCHGVRGSHWKHMGYQRMRTQHVSCTPRWLHLPNTCRAQQIATWSFLWEEDQFFPCNMNERGDSFTYQSCVILQSWHIRDNCLERNLQNESTFMQCPRRFLGMIGWDPSVAKSNWLHVDIFRFSFIDFKRFCRFLW